DPEGEIFLLQLLAEQQMTAVERFAAKHSSAEHQPSGRSLSGKYRELLPAEEPRPGWQYAFEVDLDACSGCKACVVACHTLNGLDDDESWRRVGWIQDTSRASAAYVTASCHHCVDPGCLNGCPVLAYEKDCHTGIVHHLDDQCIGCQYCTMTCPYEVPQYNPRLGVVRKCDMCRQRIDGGEAPACVAACPNEAIKIRLVEQQSVVRAARGPGEEKHLVAGAPPSSVTCPTTTYTSVGGAPAFSFAPRCTEAGRKHAHLPLAGMLTLSQWSVGTTVAAWGLAWWGNTETTLGDGAFATGWTPAAKCLSLAWCVMVIAMLVGALHLGRPLRAWKVFLGWRTSWLSREAIAFAVYLHLLTCALGLAVLDIYGFFHGEWMLHGGGWSDGHGWLGAAVGGAMIVGLMAVVCSVAIYAATHRPAWKFIGTATCFAIASAMLASAGIAVAMVGSPVGLGAAWAALSLVFLRVACPYIHLRVSASTSRKRLERLFVLRSLRLARHVGWSHRAVSRIALICSAIVLVGVQFFAIAGPEAHSASGVHSVPGATAGGILALLMLLACEWAVRADYFATSVHATMPQSHR
ncbi:MAG: molybdopterin oxidoreductase, partial [Planctomycetota bacterium]